MNESIKNQLYHLFLYELRDKIVYDEYFHVDIETKIENKDYCLVSTMYAEEGNQVPTEYYQPPEFENPCISCNAWGLVVLDEDSDAIHYEEEAEEIILQAINNYRR
jgi:hypothetical protein